MHTKPCDIQYIAQDQLRSITRQMLKALRGEPDDASMVLRNNDLCSFMTDI